MNHKRLLLISFPAILFGACANNNNASVDTETPQLATTPVSAAKVLFDAKCATCHGEDGTAGIANAANLKTSKLDSATIVKTLQNGRGGMPSFKNALTETELQKLESYVYELRK